MSNVADLRGVRVVVTDAETRLGLSVVRSLGRAGCLVTAVCNDPEARRPVGFTSRFSARREVLPAGPEEERLGTLLQLSAEHDVLVPIANWSLWKVAQQRAEFASRVRLYIPPFDAIKTATEKASTTRIAEDAGLPVPRSYHGLDPRTIDQWVRDSGVALPLVVKFAEETRKTMWRPEDRYRIVRSAEDLVREYRRMHEIGPFPLVQEYIEGGGFGFFAITDESSEPIATFCHRRLREYPISGGPSTLCESLHDPTLAALGMDLLRAMKWKGVAMVEFKQDARTGTYHFLEVNPRFWGSLPLAIQCGIDFPVYQVQMALGAVPQPPASYPAGRRMRFLMPDLLAVVQHLRAGGGRAVLGEYMRQLVDFSIRDGLFDVRDPRPAFTYVLDHLLP